MNIDLLSFSTYGGYNCLFTQSKVSLAICFSLHKIFAYVENAKLELIQF